MKKQTIVLSLGGSLIIPNEVNYSYLNEFKKIILKHRKKYQFVIVSGGGSLARKYISSIEKEKGSHKMQSLAGISATRCNARFVSYFFGIEPKQGIPLDMISLKNQVKKKDLVFCGALGYKPKQTSDTTAATISKELKSKFINLTNVDGLYDKNPNKFKNAKMIDKISWKEFHKMANKIKFKPGQHFVLDQNASKIIMNNKIETFIIGNNPKELDNFLSNRKFIGTSIKNEL